MKRAEAFEIIRKWGGSPRQEVSKGTGLVIVGELGWPLLANGRPSNTLSRATSYNTPIVSERRFLEWIGRTIPEDQARTFTTEQVVSLTGLSSDLIDRLAMFGLLEPRGGLFSFHDLSAARQLVSLLGSGIALSTIARSLNEIRKWLPDAGLSKLRLIPAQFDTLLVEHVKGLTDHRGQYVLPVGPPRDDADALFEQAQVAEEAKDLATAERLYRRVTKIDPTDPAAAFNLGNLLRDAKRLIEAEQAYRKAIKADPSFADAWYNLADILDEQGRPIDATTCLKRAIGADSSHADAIFNLAVILQRHNDHGQAATWWRRYLELDSSSSWAMRAKRSLKYCEMQVARSS